MTINLLLTSYLLTCLHDYCQKQRLREWRLQKAFCCSLVSSVYCISDCFTLLLLFLAALVPRSLCVVFLSLGSPGGVGSPGAQGLRGKTGQTGANGIRGDMGGPGLDGETGSPGGVGNPGPTGPMGQAGVQGMLLAVFESKLMHA